MNFKKHESGRSMVEMLGVLAIIGVLSVGGIAGYSLSMRRHRANGVVDLASKFALEGFRDCLKRIENGYKLENSGSGWSGCLSTMNYDETDIGTLPAGVTDMVFYSYKIDSAKNLETTTVQLYFSDKKLCQAVGSIAGSECDSNNMVRITFNQN